MRQRYTTVRIEDDAHRVVPGAGTHGQLRVVRDGGAGPDDHRVGERTQAVQMTPVLLPGDVVGVAGTRGDETVQALAELGESEVRTGQAQREVEVGEHLRLWRGVLPPAPSAVRAPDKTRGLGVRLGPDGAQPLPGRCRVECSAATGHRVSPRASSETYSPKDSTSPASSCLPFTADAADGRPMTPDLVYPGMPRVSRCLRSSARKSEVS